MAESRIIRNLFLRRWTSPPESEEVFVAVIGKTGDSTSLLNNSGRMLLHKVIGLVLVVLPVCDGDFMVKVVVMVDKGVVAWRAKVVCESEIKGDVVFREVPGSPNPNKRAKKCLFFLHVKKLD
jgi:hypothetical protein